MLVGMYYATYLGCCAIVIGIAGCVFHSAGAIYLNNAFAGNHTLARAVGRLLDLGFYLLSLGYVVLFCMPDLGMQYGTDLAKSVVGKIGGLLMVLSIWHIVNLVVLSIFGQRRPGRMGVEGQ